MVLGTPASIVPDALEACARARLYGVAGDFELNMDFS